MKDLRYLRLFDVYGALLTSHQREVCELYYMCDLSLTEIAEEKGISKQSVSDTLAKSRALLDEYEEKLRFLSVVKRLSDAEALFRTFCARHPELAAETKDIAAVLAGEAEPKGGSSPLTEERQEQSDTTNRG